MRDDRLMSQCYQAVIQVVIKKLETNFIGKQIADKLSNFKHDYILY